MGPQVWPWGSGLSRIPGSVSLSLRDAFRTLGRPVSFELSCPDSYGPKLYPSRKLPKKAPIYRLLVLSNQAKYAAVRAWIASSAQDARVRIALDYLTATE